MSSKVKLKTSISDLRLALVGGVLVVDNCNKGADATVLDEDLTVFLSRLTVQGVTRLRKCLPKIVGGWHATDMQDRQITRYVRCDDQGREVACVHAVVVRGLGVSDRWYADVAGTRLRNVIGDSALFPNEMMAKAECDAKLSALGYMLTTAELSSNE